MVVAETQAEFDDNQGSSTIILKLKPEDEVWISHVSAYPNVYGSDAERSTSFAGILLIELEPF